MLFLLFNILACDTTDVITLNRCELTVYETTPSVAIAGERLQISAYPLTEEWDTSITFNDQPAPVLSVQKQECSECEDCRSANACTTCSYCEACSLECSTCDHLLETTVPDLPSSQAEILIHNAQGSSNPYFLEIEQN